MSTSQNLVPGALGFLSWEMTHLINTLLLLVHLEAEVQFPLVLAKAAYETYLVLVPTAYKNTSSYFPLIHFIIG